MERKKSGCTWHRVQRICNVRWGEAVPLSREEEKWTRSNRSQTQLLQGTRKSKVFLLLVSPFGHVPRENNAK